MVESSKSTRTPFSSGPKGFAAALGRDKALRRYAYCIIVAHFSAYLFLLSTGLLSTITTDAEPLCWPFFENCWRFRPRPDDLQYLMAVYWILLLGSAAAIATQRFRLLWLSLTAMSLLLAGLVVLDYRLRFNQFYMLLWVSITYIIAPARAWTLTWLLVSFYFWAGTLKLNREWLSGSALYHPLWLIPRSLTAPACIYVVCLELLFVFALLRRRGILFWCVFAQLLLFHAQSLSQIHWFYPLLMWTLLLWFPFRSVHETPATITPPRSGLVIVGLFAVLQLLPYLYSRHPSLSGEGRVFGLHMFEAKQQCSAQAVISRASLPDQALDLKLYELPPRSICDPIIYYDRARNICRDPGVADVALHMAVGRSVDTQMTVIIDAPHFCSDRHRYSVFHNNAWLR
jgi:hypothetical protein